MTIDPAIPSILSAETFRGYVRTRYVLSIAERDWEVRVGRIDAAFDAALRAAGVFQWAFWTAWNPRSEIFSDEENGRRQTAAEAELRRAGVRFDRAVAAPDDCAWPAEPGVVEWNPRAEDALRRADRFGQRAILFGSRETPPVLLFCDFAAAAAALAELSAGNDAAGNDDAGRRDAADAAAAARATLAWHAAHG